MRETMIPVVSGALGTVFRGIGRVARRVGYRRTSRDCRDSSIVENVLNPETSPGDLRRLAVTQTPAKKPSAYVGVKKSR